MKNRSYPKLLKSIIGLIVCFLLASCTKTDNGDPYGTGNDDCGLETSDATIYYSGIYKDEVYKLLSRSKPWRTPSCKTGESDGATPSIHSDGTCIRDTYVDAAIQFAWAAESYWRAGSTTKAEESATYARNQLNVANSLCSDVPVPDPGIHCNTLEIWPCGGSDGGGSNYGQIMFWIATDLGTISVNCNGSTQTITMYYSSGAPDCGTNGCANFTNLIPGTYSYTATSAATNWNGSITVNAGGCTRVQLTGSGGGGGGGGSNKGQAMFWLSSDPACGTITVYCNGTSGNITNYYSSGIPNCGANGCATFDLNPGTYHYTAECSGHSWDGYVTVYANDCSTMKLTSNGGGGGGGNSPGQVLFWTNNPNTGYITVTLWNQPLPDINTATIEGDITSYYSAAPSCGASGCVTGTRESPGIYQYHATSTNGLIWNGTVSIQSGQCSTKLLY
jgi:hypothetical protein